MANLSQLTLPVKDTITGVVTSQTFDLAGSDSANFIGTRAEWNALTTAEKEEYDTMDIYGEYNDAPIDPSPTQGSTNAVASGGVYSALQNVETNIAGIESSATASQAYTVGKYIIFGNVLYKVIASIAQGDTLTVGTNLQAAKIADEVSDHLSVNGTEFFFDTHDGKFGYNTSANRGADTFVPFKVSEEVPVAIYYCASAVNSISGLFTPGSNPVTIINGNTASNSVFTVYCAARSGYIRAKNAGTYRILALNMNGAFSCTTKSVSANGDIWTYSGMDNRCTVVYKID